MLEGAPPELTYDKGELLAREIADLFVTESTAVDFPEKGDIQLRGTFLIDLADDYDRLRERFERFGYTPLIRRLDDNSKPFILAQPQVYVVQPLKWKLSLALFLATVASTMLVGAGEAIFEQGVWPGILQGWPFSLSMLSILLAHEFGHYFAARYHKVDASLPYFIPFPTILGTMGAVIVQRTPPTNRRALLDVGAAGPLVGLLFAIPITFIGLATSEVGPLPEGGGYFLEGNSALYALAKVITFGEFLPSNGIDVQLNQMALAGWAGLLVTAINLMPVGQLDGGHMAYVLFGDKARYFLWPTIIGLFIISVFFGGSWYIWIGLLFLFGRGHPPPLDDVTPLDPRRRFIAILSLALFFVLFTPQVITQVP